jgi:protein TonB
MKRNEKKVPEFDEIIFENRNKAYGAYDLRKRYKSNTNISILTTVVLSTLLVAALSLKPEKGTAVTGQTDVILVMQDPIIPDVAPPPVENPPAEIEKIINYLKPVITDDTSEITTFLPITDDLISTAKDGNVTDTGTVTYTEISDPVIPVVTAPRIIVDVMPEYPGGNSELLKYISANLRYPADAQDNNIQGKVTLKFVVNPDGSVDRIEVIKGVHQSLDNEAIRVIASLPGFIPGKQGGVPVPVWFTIPVLFQLKMN